MDNFEPVVEVLFQEGSLDGPETGYFGYGLNSANGTMEIRGATSRFAAQKSFKIRLNREMNAWNGLWTINLNKHPFDLTRIRNKLSFDYLEIIPHITSLRTQFINLWIKDLSADPRSEDFIDYGLFTMVEQPNNLFLKTRGLDTEGHLYKSEFFEFHRYPEYLKSRDDPNFDELQFRQILDIRGNEDHSKLLAMLDDVNNYDLDINKVIARHFNRENYLTWLAVNILFENIDTRTQNFFLYSPKNVNTWYFLPWDYDGTWDFYNQVDRDRGIRRASWEHGVSNYWGVVLHRRFFKDPDNVKELIDKMEQLLEIITYEQTNSFLSIYHPVVSQFVKRPPDSEHLSDENFETEFWRIADDPNRNFTEFFESKENPMPIFLGVPYEREGKIVFRWDESFDLQNDDIMYNFQISNSPEFKNIITEHTNLVETEIAIDPLPAGEYFWRVSIQDSQGNKQVAFDKFEGHDGTIYFGIRNFTIE
jgi:spore coat protein H